MFQYTSLITYIQYEDPHRVTINYKTVKITCSSCSSIVWVIRIVFFIHVIGWSMNKIVYIIVVTVTLDTVYKDIAKMM